MTDVRDLEWDDSHLAKEEDQIIERLKEMILNDKVVHEHILDQIQFYWGRSYDFDVRGSLTNLQEEFVCQCQVQIMNKILAKVMVS